MQKTIYITMDELDLIADIIWWHKGFQANQKEETLSDIGKEHLEVLRKIRVTFVPFADQEIQIHDVPKTMEDERRTS